MSNSDFQGFTSRPLWIEKFDRSTVLTGRLGKNFYSLENSLSSLYKKFKCLLAKVTDLYSQLLISFSHLKLNVKEEIHQEEVATMLQLRSAILGLSIF